MLQSLSIQNFALIEQLELSFQSGLNIITGETGAGKSIIVDALSLLLGERGSTSFVRRGAKKAIIEGLFEVRDYPPIIAFLEQYGFEPLQEGLLLLRREIHANGLSRAFINDVPAKIATLKTLGEFLVDFHGQHEHQSLLRVSVQQKLLDNVGGLEGIVEQYRKALIKLKELIAQYQSLRDREQQLQREAEFNRFQLEEIQRIAPSEGEEEAIARELSILENSEFVVDALHQLVALLYEQDQAVRDRLVQARSLIEQLQRFDPVFEQYRQEIQSIIVMVEELTRFLQQYGAEIEFDPERIEQLRQRQSELRQLIRKYGSIEAALAEQQRLERELELVENFDRELERLQQQIEQQRQIVGKVGWRLSQRRQKIAREIERQVERLLSHLGIASPKFVVQLKQRPVECRQLLAAVTAKGCFHCFDSGIDQVEFWISTNVGEAPQPLTAVASGGEISRIMLALKTTLAQSDRLPMLVFDEIDVGISGHIAQKVGQALKNLSRYHQIIAITHLPQIAALADTHILVQKQVRKQRTVIQARCLEGEERFYEVARLMGGETITPALVESAKELARQVNR